ncbi:S-adenosylmethionine:tRNA ribosyltransferase-isomerase [Bacillus sp. MUM 13]|uniref:S-adenosylmethionine:tRNA ribosyltransferase-isomerase n=1 Tax=Bacillus sp. MUM 13 TaxID=1678001 RepID=UPI0008F5D899|nr:S-adenosylmethionine:tRNA ribosyltransferase-isomerase [Bacillus sp. MUM 13]OIK15046.1 S-adenosylmethionine tRNA ribosyltransferase [Bacillus sp. MUM 13]
MTSNTSINFYLPDELNATAPPERRGIRRDHVKLMVLDRNTGQVRHDVFYSLEDYLKPGDVIVLNDSRTLPAILIASHHRLNNTLTNQTEIRLARRVHDDIWDVLAVTDQLKAGDTFHFSNTLFATVIDIPCNGPISRLRFSKKGTSLLEDIYSLGEPVRYEYINTPWELEYYQTVFASKPGSVEMPSAGRPFSWQQFMKLQKKGIKLAFLQLHTGLSYFLDDKWEHDPTENHEEYKVPIKTMNDIQQAKASGHKVIAVGTTVVRALETAVQMGQLSGWTNLYVTKDYHLQIVDAIITGLHEPKASHLDMLCAFVSAEHLYNAYELAIKEQYLWHEFGDMNLII